MRSAATSGMHRILPNAIATLRKAAVSYQKALNCVELLRLNVRVPSFYILACAVHLLTALRRSCVT